jgi:hypothetical protein
MRIATVRNAHRCCQTHARSSLCFSLGDRGRVGASPGGADRWLADTTAPRWRYSPSSTVRRWGRPPHPRVSLHLVPLCALRGADADLLHAAVRHGGGHARAPCLPRPHVAHSRPAPHVRQRRGDSGATQAGQPARAVQGQVLVRPYACVHMCVQTWLRWLNLIDFNVFGTSSSCILLLDPLALLLFRAFMRRSALGWVLAVTWRNWPVQAPALYAAELVLIMLVHYLWKAFCQPVRRPEPPVDRSAQRPPDICPCSAQGSIEENASQRPLNVSARVRDSEDVQLAARPPARPPVRPPAGKAGRSDLCRPHRHALHHHASHVRVRRDSSLGARSVVRQRTRDRRAATMEQLWRSSHFSTAKASAATCWSRSRPQSRAARSATRRWRRCSTRCCTRWWSGCPSSSWRSCGTIADGTSAARTRTPPSRSSRRRATSTSPTRRSSGAVGRFASVARLFKRVSGAGSTTPCCWLAARSSSPWSRLPRASTGSSSSTCASILSSRSRRAGAAAAIFPDRGRRCSRTGWRRSLSTGRDCVLCRRRQPTPWRAWRWRRPRRRRSGELGRTSQSAALGSRMAHRLRFKFAALSARFVRDPNLAESVFGAALVRGGIPLAFVSGSAHCPLPSAA